MNTTHDSAASGGAGAGGVGIGDGECRFANQSTFYAREQTRRRKSIHDDLRGEVGRLSRTGSPAPPMHLLKGEPHRTATEPLDRSATPLAEQLARFNVPTQWSEQASSKPRVTHVGRDDLPPATRALSPEPKQGKPAFRNSEFHLASPNGPSRLSQARTATGTPSRHGAHSPLRAEHSLDATHLGSSHRPASAATRQHQRAPDTAAARSHSSLGFSRADAARGGAPVDEDERRSQVSRLDMSNLRQLTASQTPAQLKQMAVSSTLAGSRALDASGASLAGSQRRSASQVSGIFLAMKYSPAQLGFDGYGAPASLPEDIDEILGRHGEKGNPDTKSELRETLRSSASSPALKRSIKGLPLDDGFVNPTTLKILRQTKASGAVPFGNSKTPVVSKQDLMLEKAQDVMHDTPSYKKHATGFNMRGEMLVYSWAAPHDFRGQYANPRIHAPGKPPAPATSEKAKFKTFADDKVKMAALAEAAKLDAIFQEPRGVRLVSEGGLGFFPIPAGGGRPTRAVKHKLDAFVGYHKYLGKDLLNLKSDHKADIPGEPELTFQRAPLIIDDKSRVAREEEPLKGEWKGAPDLYPGSLVPTATRHRS
eukprot:Tamp_02253.p1 GENE.Tamp_02253~~Tamp_02253.p1  ORF type:complete len:595 (+),score=110.36 Tamp_02253:1250-3034(+)